MSSPLETYQWLVEIDDPTSQACAIMRETEFKWLAECRELGIDVRKGQPRKTILFVNDTQQLPDFSNLLRTRADYLAKLKDLAAEQKKEDTIGIRSTETPFWLGGTKIDEGPMPSYRASVITYREQTAYRAGKVTAEQALDYMQRRLIRAEEILRNAEMNYKHDRIERLTERMKELEKAFKSAKRFLERNTSGIMARLISGTAFKITASGLDEDGKKVSFSSSIATLILVPVGAEYEYKEAPKRNRPKQVQVLKRFDNVEFYRPKLS